MQIKPRYELKNARLRMGLTEVELADKIESFDVETYRRWEAGIQTPHPGQVKILCDFFEVDHPKKLNLDAQFNAPAQSREEEIMYRRELFEYLRATSIVAGVDPSILLNATVDDPKEFLRSAHIVVNECWAYYDQGNYALADSIITVLMAGLRSLAMEKSPSQHEAASLAIEARILQTIIATPKEDYKRRESLGLDMVLIVKHLRMQTSIQWRLHGTGILTSTAILNPKPLLLS